MSHPIVTVVTVTYNAATAIDATLTSIVAQTSPEFEWLIVDGASRDDTLERIRHSAQQVDVRIFSEKDRGLYDAMNKSLSWARGQYVIYMNAGDIFFDNMVLENFCRYVEQLPLAPAMVYGHTSVSLSDGNSFMRRTRPLRYIWHGQPTIHQSVFFRREAHLSALYPFAIYPVSSDYAVMARLQMENPQAVVLWDRVVSVFNNDPNSFGNRQLSQRVKDAWRVQRDVIGSSIAHRAISAARRLAANVYYNFR